MQDTGKFRKNTNDQFYTNPTVAKKCIEMLVSTIPDVCCDEYTWLEPSAGNGSFLMNIPYDVRCKIGIDIDPRCPDILKCDYLTWNPRSDSRFIVIGNPPFGRQSCTAKLFIKKSCKFAHVIAFILPRSFSKPSMYNVFDKRFHLILSEDLGGDSFLLNGKKYNVPCVFQIWQKHEYDRVINSPEPAVGFKYVSQCDDYDFAIRRVGGLAGKCYVNDKRSVYNSQSHNFISLVDSSILSQVITKINSHVFPSNTVGPRSLSKSELNEVINNTILSITRLD